MSHIKDELDAMNRSLNKSERMADDCSKMLNEMKPQMAAMDQKTAEMGRGISAITAILDAIKHRQRFPDGHNPNKSAFTETIPSPQLKFKNSLV